MESNLSKFKDRNVNLNNDYGVVLTTRFPASFVDTKTKSEEEISSKFTSSMHVSDHGI